MPVVRNKIDRNDATRVASIAKQYKKPDVDSSRLSVVDSTISAMKKYVDGYNWTVDYYSVITASDDRVSTLDENNGTASQQYNRVNYLNLKLTTVLNNTNYENLTGTALVDSVLTPRLGDYIKGTVLDGTEALFTVVKVNAVSYNLDKLYEIEFKFDTNITLDSSRVESLNSKIVRDYYAVEGDNGVTILDPGSYTWRNRVSEYEKGLPNLFDSFYRYGYPVYSKDGKIIYDPHISELFNVLTNGRNLKHKDTGLDINKTQLGILIGDSSPVLFKLSKATLLEIPHYRTNVYDVLGFLPSEISHIVKVGQEGDWEYPTTDSKKSILPRVTLQTTGQYLYNINNNSSLEILLKQMSKSEALNRKHFMLLLDDITTWNNEQRYYYIPITLAICQYELRNLRVKGVTHV